MLCVLEKILMFLVISTNRFIHHVSGIGYDIPDIMLRFPQIKLAKY